jgi:hypothetical protein
MTPADGVEPIVTERQAARAISAVREADVQDLFVGDREYAEAFGEDLARTLDVDTWATGVDWEGAIARLRNEIEAAVHREESLRETVRREVLPRIGKSAASPAEAGLYLVNPDELSKVHEGLLFPGQVEAIDGTSVSHDTLPLGITQIGIAVVSYGGTSATFSQRVYRKEIAGRSSDPFKAALEVIDRRDARAGVDQADGLSELARRGIMTFAERKILQDKASALWRIGHGAPAPYELLTGSGNMRLLEASLDVLRRMILHRKRFVFIPSAPAERGLLTIGNALSAGEYVVINTIEHAIARIVEGGHYAARYKDKAMQFVRECGPHVMYGLYSASEHAPPYMFYAHREDIHLAARIAIADSILRPARGFPMLIDVADVTCRSTFGAAGFYGIIHDAYAQAGAPMRYFGERETRR